MLKIINNLSPFFEDCYRGFGVREYARIISVSPPTASKLLKAYFKEKLLQKESFRGNTLFHANRVDSQFIDLSRIYWRHKLGSLIIFLEKNLLNPAVVLFGSLSKAEAKSDSDIDIAVLSVDKRPDVSKFERRLKRGIQIFYNNSIKDIKNKELTNNILNGYVLRGRLRL